MNRAHIGAAVLTLALAACPGPAPMDEPDAMGPPADADAGAVAGLTIEFRSDPPIPGEINGGGLEGEIDSVEITLADLRALGDVPPDDRTTEPSFTLDWLGPACGVAECARFAQAAPGLYSLVVATVVSFRIRGEIEVDDDNPRDFEIVSDSADLEVEVEFLPVIIQPGATGRMRVEVRFDNVIQEVDWESIPPGSGGELIVDADEPQFGSLRSRLIDAFRVDD
jgi:hypothetical protein